MCADPMVSVAARQGVSSAASVRRASEAPTAMRVRVHRHNTEYKIQFIYYTTYINNKMTV